MPDISTSHIKDTPLFCWYKPRILAPVDRGSGSGEAEQGTDLYHASGLLSMGSMNNFQ